jgi:hypothetical protein
MHPSTSKNMFRVSYNSDVSREWYSRVDLPAVKKRRVYRWGTRWGILGDGWMCEKRETIHSSETMIVEMCSSCSELPPKDVDDLWEEDYCCMKGLEYNGLVFLKGSREEVLEVAKRQGLPMPDLPVLAPSQSTPSKGHDKRKPKSCLIRD